MKIKRLDSTKRNFFAKAGIGLFAGMLVSRIPFSDYLGRNYASAVNDKKLKVQINPLAVKRKHKDS